MAYTPTTWVNGTTPVNATNMNHIETFLATINSAATDSNGSSDGSGNWTVNSIAALYDLLNPTAVPLSGGTAGTATLYQPSRGTYKRVMILLNGFRTAGSAQTIALPVAFTTQAAVHTGNLGSATGFNGFALLAGGSGGAAQSIQMVTSLAAAGGGNSSVNTMFGNSFGNIFGAFDTIQFKASSSGNASGIIIIEGV